ncbi:MAG: acetoin utilization protein AcuC [Anaerolineales bacterium]
MRKAVVLYSPDLWQYGHGPQHPMKPERLKRTFELLDWAGALRADNVRVVEPRMATKNELALFHTPEYIEITQQLSNGEQNLPAENYGYGPGDNPVFLGMYDSEGLKAGSSLQAAQLLHEGECDVAFSFGGGLHHGGPGFASGFCVFNDCAVAIQWLINQGLRVAYVDIDVHHGDGVQNAFYQTDRVLTISLHQDGRTLFPGTGFTDEIGEGEGFGYSVNIPLPPLTYDEAYLRAFKELVPPLLARFEPDIVVTQLGADTHYTDPLASLALTTNGQQALYRLLGEMASKWLALGGGGYAIDVVPRSWALAFGEMSGQELPKSLPKAYRTAYGGRYLRDQQGPDLNDAIRFRVDEAVDAVTAEVKRASNLQS